MATVDTRYKVVLNIGYSIEKVQDDGTLAPFSSFNGSANYHNMDYVQIVAVQQVVTNMAQQLNDFGWSSAEAIGIPEALFTEEIAKTGRVKKEKK